MTAEARLSYRITVDARSGSVHGADERYTAKPRSSSSGRAMVDERQGQQLTVTQRAETAYSANYELLSYLAACRFRVPEDEVCGIIHDVFVSFIRSEARIGRTSNDERAWLVGAVCNASRYYWRKHRNRVDLAEMNVTTVDIAEVALNRVALAAVLRDLPERCRDLLCRRYAEEYTPGELAAEEALTSGSTRNLISKCLVAARKAFSRRNKDKR